jgi:DNA integrity scanning protein DisA with diadenylate cyclase activity
MDLSELKNYINIHQHLPEIPSESEVLTNGINLGETNALLLKKIEELTLYVIDLKKENEQIKMQLSELKDIQ